MKEKILVFILLFSIAMCACKGENENSLEKSILGKWYRVGDTDEYYTEFLKDGTCNMKAGKLRNTDTYTVDEARNVIVFSGGTEVNVVEEEGMLILENSTGRYYRKADWEAINRKNGMEAILEGK